MICGCSSTGSSPAPQAAYSGVPAGLLERCIVRDIEINTTGDIVVSRGIYVEAFNKCAARVDAIRDFDAKARAASN